VSRRLDGSRMRLTRLSKEGISWKTREGFREGKGTVIAKRL
jgi:hypothetical protein